MRYKALVDFADLQDGKRLYHEGETFPRDGLSVSEKRLAELSGSDNRMGFPLIGKVEEPTIEESEAPAPAEQKTSRKRGKKDASTGL